MVYVDNEIGHPLRHRTVAKTVARTNREKKVPVRDTAYTADKLLFAASDP